MYIVHIYIYTDIYRYGLEKLVEQYREHHVQQDSAANEDVGDEEEGDAVYMCMYVCMLLCIIMYMCTNR